MKLSRIVEVAAIGITILANSPAWSATTISVLSGPATIGATNTSTAGTSANPWTVSESITAIAPVVLSLTNPQTNPVGPSDSTGLGFNYGKWLSVSVTNNSGSIWSSFDLELQSVLGTPSTNGDGLSFAQAQNLAFTSDKFSTVHRTEDVRDFLNFDGGSVGIGQTVLFFFAITDNQERNTFYLSETPNRTVGTVPLPASLPLFVSGLGALALLARRRKQKQIEA